MKGGHDSRRCLPNGMWSGDLPICDTTLSLEKMNASSRESLKLYPPQFAIDGNPRTCYYSGRSPPKYWRLDMGESKRVLSVALTVPFASSEQAITVYVVPELSYPGNITICSSFNGVFGTQTNVLVCGSDGMGISGRYLHIQDDSKNFDYFGLCEVKIFVEKGKRAPFALSAFMNTLLPLNIRALWLRPAGTANAFYQSGVIPCRSPHCQLQMLRRIQNQRARNADLFAQWILVGAADTLQRFV